MDKQTVDPGVIIFDIDGTLADCEHRRHFVEGKKKRFDLFYEAMYHDKPNIPIVRLNNLLHTAGWEIFIFTGRPERYRTVTMDWLYQKGIYHDGLFMRPAEREYDKDCDIKSDMLKNLNRSVFMAIDDRNQVVKMWRSLGITCLQVADGDF